MRNAFSRGGPLQGLAIMSGFVLALVALAALLPDTPRGHDHLWIGLGGLIVNAANLQTVFTGFRAAFQQGSQMVTATYQRIATVVPSTTREEKYGWLGSLPRLREWVGDRVVHSLSLHDYAIKNRKFESTVAVSRDQIDDDSYALLAPTMQEMGYAAAEFPDELVWGALAAGFSTKCYDGQYFFDTDHPVGGVGDAAVTSVSNMQAGSGAPWYLLATKRPLKPLIYQARRPFTPRAPNNLDDRQVFMTDEFLFGVDGRCNTGYGFWQQAFGSKAALTADNFVAARAAMSRVTNDAGKPLGIRPDLLVVGVSNEAAAEAVINAQFLAGGGTNTLYQAVEVLVVPWLA